MKRIFITGIGTDVGKSIGSAVIVQALEADYWKPVQSGSSEQTDTELIKTLVSNSKTKFQAETYSFLEPVSPHLAAELEGKRINFDEIITPNSTNNYLCIEGAGGLFVPLNDEKFVVDLIKPEDIVILVSRHYVGSINHTLLSINELNSREINFGILFIGESNPSTEKIITKKAKVIARIPLLAELNSTSIANEALKLQKALSDFLSNF